MEKSYDKLKRISNKGWVAEYQAEISVEVLNKNMEAAVDEAVEDFEAPGFRKGKVPRNIVRQNVGEFKLLNSAADASLYDALREIISDEKLEVLGSPEVYITKIAVGSPVEFRMKVALNPEIGLPDYRKTGKEVSAKAGKSEVADNEINDAMEQIRQTFAEQNGGGDGKHLPEVDDEFVKRVSSFKTVAELRDEIKKRLVQEKDLYAKEKNRDEILGEIIKNAKLEVPELLIDQEFHRLSHEREEELQKVGISMEEYLKQTKKTAEEMEKEDRKMIENRLKGTLILQAIRKNENISAEPKEIEEETSFLRQYYPDRDETTLAESAEAMIIQRKLFAVLEGDDADNNR